MSWRGKKSSFRVITNVPVMLLLSTLPAMATYLTHFLAIVLCDIRTYFKGVWSRFKMRFQGMLCSSTNVAILWRCSSSPSCSAPSGISTLPVVFILCVNPILWKKLFAQYDESRSIWSKFSWGFRAIRTFAIDTAISELTGPPSLLVNISVPCYQVIPTSLAYPFVVTRVPTSSHASPSSVVF